MKLRKGRTKTILESSVDSALLAVEVYNKPRTTFRTEAYVSLMIMAWTRLFHAYFQHTIGDVYYYRKKDSNRYVYVDGERKAWELTRCLKEYGKLNEPAKKNVEFFIKLRNKIEHRNIDKSEIDTLIFGECQSFLYNYESELVKIFGTEYSLNESLAYSLQFSLMRTDDQRKANRSVLSKELRVIKNFVDSYRTSLRDEIFQSQEYSIKLIQVPKVSNTSRNDLAVEFVNWSSLDEEDKEAYEKVSAIIKDKVVRVEAANVGKLKPSNVIERVNRDADVKINQYDHRCLYIVFSIRPPSNSEDPFDTNTKYCHYNEVHSDYLYQEEWVDFIVQLINNQKLSIPDLKSNFDKGNALNIEDYE